jgi:hypothetical protein
MGASQVIDTEDKLLWCETGRNLELRTIWRDTKDNFDYNATMSAYLPEHLRTI